MNTSDTHKVGSSAEMYVAYILLSLGFDVAKPLNDGGSVDLLCWKSGKIHKIQVKSVEYANRVGRYRVDMKVSLERGHSEKTYDFVIAVAPTGVYVIPSSVALKARYTPLNDNDGAVHFENWKIIE